MNTFLPYQSFFRSAKILDNKRLGKQRVETYQIYLALTKKNYGWQNHPAVKMWRGFELALIEYGLALCEEWKGRGFKDSLEPKFLKIKEKLKSQGKRLYFPAWLSSRRLLLGYRSGLLRKDRKYYKKEGWKVNPDLGYYWPISAKK